MAPCQDNFVIHMAHLLLLGRATYFSASVSSGRQKNDENDKNDKLDVLDVPYINFASES